MDTKQLVRLGRLLAQHRRLTLSTVSNYATNDGKVLPRLANGVADITSRRAARIAQWFSDNWPEDLAWPSDIPRPPPLPDSPAARPVPVADPLAETAVALEDYDRAFDALDQAALERAQRRVMRAALTLGPDGRIASVEALCKAVGVARTTYDDAVRRYKDGRDGGWPRPRSGVARMLDALIDSGDVRFASRQREAS